MPQHVAKRKKWQLEASSKSVPKTLTTFFFDLISFNGPRAIVINLGLILLLLFLLPTSIVLQGPKISLYQNVVPLLVKNCPNAGFFSNCELPSYGLTRGMSRLLHGDVAGALSYNRGTIYLFLVMLVLLIINLWKIHKNDENA